MAAAAAKINMGLPVAIQEEAIEAAAAFVCRNSLPELMDFKLFGKTILVVNKKFRLFLASQLGK